MLVLTACGGSENNEGSTDSDGAATDSGADAGSDDGAEENGSEAGDAEGDNGGEEAAAPSASGGECAMPTSVQARLEGTGGLEALELADAVAINASGGLATVIASSEAIDRNTSFLTAFPTVSEDGVMLQVGIFADSGNSSGLAELAAGDVFAIGDDRYPSVTVVVGSSEFTSNDQAGTVEVLAIDGESLCLGFDFTTSEGPALQGVIAAERVDS